MFSVKKGVYDDCTMVSATRARCRNTNKLTMVLHSVNSVSNSVFSAAMVSSFPSSPFNRLRLKRIYQFVNSSTSSSSRGMMVYKR